MCQQTRTSWFPTGFLVRSHLRAKLFMFGHAFSPCTDIHRSPSGNQTHCNGKPSAVDDWRILEAMFKRARLGLPKNEFRRCQVFKFVKPVWGSVYGDGASRFAGLLSHLLWGVGGGGGLITFLSTCTQPNAHTQTHTHTHTHTHWMLRCRIFSRTCTRTHWQLRHGIFSCTCTHTHIGCYVVGSSLAFAHTHWMLRCRIFSFTCTRTHTGCYVMGSTH